MGALTLEDGDLRNLLAKAQARILAVTGMALDLGLEGVHPLRVTVRVRSFGGRFLSLSGRILSSGLALGGTPVLHGQVLSLRWDGAPVAAVVLRGLVAAIRWKKGRCGNEFIEILPDHRIRVDLGRIPVGEGDAPEALLGSMLVVDRFITAEDGLHLHFHLHPGG